MTLKEFDALLKTVTPSVYQNEADRETYPYATWHEYRKKHYYADGKPHNGFWRVQVDYFTKTKLDPVADDFEQALADAGVSFNHMVLFDTATKITRHLYECEVLYG